MVHKFGDCHWEIFSEREKNRGTDDFSGSQFSEGQRVWRDQSGETREKKNKSHES